MALQQVQSRLLRPLRPSAKASSCSLHNSSLHLSELHFWSCRAVRSSSVNSCAGGEASFTGSSFTCAAANMMRHLQGLLFVCRDCKQFRRRRRKPSAWQDLYHVRSTPYTGEDCARGVFAVQEIQQGDIVEVAHCIKLSAQEYHNFGRHTTLEHYLFKGRNGSMLLALGVGSLFNHSRQPSLDYRADYDSLIIRYFAARNVAPGEELTIYYDYRNARNSMQYYKECNAHQYMLYKCMSLPTEHHKPFYRASSFEFRHADTFWLRKNVQTVFTNSRQHLACAFLAMSCIGHHTDDCNFDFSTKGLSHH